MPKGRKSTQQKLEEHLKQPISKILKDFEGLETADLAAKKVSEITGGKVTATPLTMTRLASSLSLNTKRYPWGKPPAKGRRGKMPIRTRLESDSGKSIWEILKPLRGMKKEDAAKKLKVNVLSLKKMIETALDKKEPEAKDFEQWAVKLRRGRKKSEDALKPPAETHEIIYKCKCCGNEKSAPLEAHICNAPYWETFARARRCQKCRNWGNFDITIKAKREIIYMTSVLPEPNDITKTYEYYEVDKNGKRKSV